LAVRRKKEPVFRKQRIASCVFFGNLDSVKTTHSRRSREVRRVSARRTKGAASKPPKIDKLLVPIDFSPPSLEAIEFALPLLKQFRAELHLVHVFEPDYLLASMMTMPLIVPELEAGKRVRRHLKDVAKKYGIELRPGNIHALKGAPFEEICRLVPKIDIDLIVTSTRGNTGLKHLALGSTVERIVRYSPCPVLVTRKQNRGKVPFKFGKILVPIDFSECSMKALDYAKGLAKQFDSGLVLLHSVHIEYYVASDEYTRYDFPLLMAQSEKAAKAQMGDLVRQTKEEGFKIETALEVGHPGDQICAQAQDRRADLIVTSTHGRTGLKHILIGSTAEFVVRHAPCPVLVVPNHERPVITSTNT
jgi:nucleotide-binding universal stress UspA family protein